MERRTLVRLLVGLGVGIPIAVEAVTFGGLIGSRLADGGDEQADGASGYGDHDPGGTPAGREGEPVTVGDELLPATPQSDVVVGATIGSGDPRTFRLRVAVENTGGDPYELQLSAVTTDRGTTVPGGGRTGLIPPGERDTVTGSWRLPEGETPESVIVVATIEPADASAETVTRRVRLTGVS